MSASQTGVSTTPDPTALEALRLRVRSFVEREAIPRESAALAHDVAGLDAVLGVLREKAREQGLYAPQLPVAWGGLGLSWSACAVLIEEAGRSFLGAGALHCAAPDQPNMLTLLLAASAAQQARYLGPLTRGEQRACFAMTEPPPGAGSDPGMLRTRAQRCEGGWRLDGQKCFISGGVGADFALVLAQTDEGATLFIVEAGTPGYRVVRDIGMVTGYQVGGHAQIELQDCRVAHDAVIGQPGQGLALAQLRLEPARLAHCLRYIGRAGRAMELAQAYARARSSFGQRLADLQQIQAMVADSHIDLHASRLMARDCALAMDEGRSVKDSSAMTKVFVSEAVGRVADRAVQIMGALGLSDDSPVSMIWRELRAFRIYDGANELHRATLARRLLRAPTTTGDAHVLV